MSPNEIVNKILSLGFSLTLGAAILFPPTASASVNTAAPVWSIQSSSVDQQPVDYTQDVRDALAEIQIAERMLQRLQDSADSAALSYQFRLEQIVDEAIAVDQELLPRYADVLRGQLQSLRLELLNDIGDAKAWLGLAWLVTGDDCITLPQRFVEQVAVEPVALPTEDIAAEAFLGSSAAPTVS